MARALERLDGAIGVAALSPQLSRNHAKAGLAQCFIDQRIKAVGVAGHIQRSGERFECQLAGGAHMGLPNIAQCIVNAALFEARTTAHKTDLGLPSPVLHEPVKQCLGMFGAPQLERCDAEAVAHVDVVRHVPFECRVDLESVLPAPLVDEEVAQRDAGFEEVGFERKRPSELTLGQI